MAWFWRQYLGQDCEAADPYAAPARAASLAGLPPTHIVTAECDVLRDEGEAFAARLREAGVPTTLRRYDGMIHGFAHFAEPFDVGRQAVCDLAEVVRTTTGSRTNHVPGLDSQAGCPPQRNGAGHRSDAVASPLVAE
jgi:acetyl esterase